MSVQCLQEYVTFVKDLVTIGAAVIAAIIAIKGYDTWKKQLKGRAEYELARRLLRSVYKVRDSVHIVRNPFVSGAEAEQAMKEAGIELDADRARTLDPEYLLLQSEAVYQRRWKGIQAAWSELDVDSLEAEVLWGRSIVDGLKPLRQLTRKLNANLFTYLSSKREGLGRGDQGYDAEVERVVYRLGKDDPFDAEIKKAVEEVEKILRPYLSLGLAREKEKPKRSEVQAGLHSQDI